MAKEDRSSVSRHLQQLEDLGHPDRIAAFMGEQGIMGSRESLCPIESYLTKRTGLNVSAGRTTVIYWRGDQDRFTELDMGTHCKSFVAQYDHGNYPGLKA